MNTSRFAWVAVALCLVVSAAHAQDVPDPKILIAGSGYSEALYGTHFTFASNATGGGSHDFFNASGFDWTELEIGTAMPYGYIGDSWLALNSASFYDISSDLFASTSLMFGPNGLTIRFFGIDEEHNGIPYEGSAPGKDDGNTDPPWGSHFSIGLDNGDSLGVGGWLGSDHNPLSFDATANPVPEPGTFALMFGGFLVLGLHARRRKK